MTDAEYRRLVGEQAKEMAEHVMPETHVDVYNELVADPSDWEHLVDASGRDWADVASALAQAIADRKAEDAAIGAFVMGELGFDLIGTGGGCDAYWLQLPGGDPKDPPHLLVTHGEDAAIPMYWDDPLVVGKFASHGDDGDYEHFPTVRDFEQAVRQGRSRLVAAPSSTGRPPAATGSDTGDALARIDAHRKGLLMSPLDTTGWTDQDVLDEATRIARLPNVAAGLLPRPMVR